MNIKKLLPIALIGLLGTAGSVSAAPITFEFDSGTPGLTLLSSSSITQMGTTVAMVGSDTLYNSRVGLGVGSDGLITTGENVSFTFTPNAVSLLSGIVFESARTISGADFELYGDSVLLSNISFTNSFLSGGTFLTTLTFGGWTATEFNFVGMSDNGFTIKRLTVEVPEPGMVAMLGLGLLMAGVATRRRRKS